MNNNQDNSSSCELSIREESTADFLECNINSSNGLIDNKSECRKTDSPVSKCTCCTSTNVKKTLSKKFPITLWLPRYTAHNLRNDIIAGLTVGLTVIPQALAYAAIAGLPLEYGLYSAFMGCFVYCVFGSSKDITLGPTAIMSILVAQYARDPWIHTDDVHSETSNVQLAIILTLASGLLQFVLGIFKLGCVVDFISHPVISGFTSAAAVVIGGGQIKKILGLQIPPGHNFFEMMMNTFKNLNQTRVWDLVLGVLCIILLVLLKILKEKAAEIPEKARPSRVYLYHSAWFIGTARNAIVVILSSLLAFVVTDTNAPKDTWPFTLTPETPGGIPTFAIPTFQIEIPGTNDTTTFGEVMGQLSTGIVVIALMGLLESVAIATAFARKNSYKIDATQELIAIGAANVISSCVGSYPVTGSFSRTAVNSQSHVATPLGGIFTGSLVLISLAFVSDAFQYIPSSALAAVIVMAVINMFDFHTAKTTFKVNKLDTLPLALTFFLSFWDLAYGILCGISVSLIILMIPHTRPSLTVQSKDGDTLTICIKRGLDFPGTRYFEKNLVKLANENNCSVVNLECSHVSSLDYSAAEAFNFCFKRFLKENITLNLLNMKEKFQVRLIDMGIPQQQLNFINCAPEVC